MFAVVAEPVVSPHIPGGSFPRLAPLVGHQRGTPGMVDCLSVGGLHYSPEHSGVALGTLTGVSIHGAVLAHQGPTGCFVVGDPRQVSVAVRTLETSHVIGQVRVPAG